MANTITPQDFVNKWRHVTLKERSSSQEHFIDICRMVGHPTPAEHDPTGDRFTFERGADKQGGGQGWADVWYKGRFAWEYKGKHANLEKAYQQLLQYREALENPPLLIVSDTDRILIHTNFTNTVKQVYELALDDLLAPDHLDKLRAAFYNPEQLRAPKSTQQVTEEAAGEFATLADQLRKWGEAPDRIAHFLIRLLFCLFAEDIGLLPKELFSNLVARTRHRAPAFAQQLQQLFDAMQVGGWFGVEEIVHFDGGLFDDAAVLELDSTGLDILARVSRLDWSSIEPSILGTLFQRSLDPSMRAQLGAHYTSKDDILLIVEPVLMAPLRRRWEQVQAQAQELAAKRDAAKGGRRTKLQNELTMLLTGFAAEIAAIRVLDPACGSANFLYVALRLLLDLEKEVITLAGDLGVGRFFPSVSPAQLYGIEINEYAHELAQTTVWIGYIQWLNENGFGHPGEPGYLHIDFATFANVGDDGRPNEWPETVEYLFRLRQLLYLPIVRVDPHVWTPSLGNLGETAGLFDTYYERETMPFRAFRGCTDKFKIIPQDSFLTFLIERAAGFGVDLHIRQVIGYSADEADRAAAFTPSHPNIHPRFPLVEWGWKRRETVANFQRLAPLVAKLVGLPTKSGCWFCPFQPVGRRLHDGAPQPRTWLALEDSHPDLAALGMAMEARQNARRLAQGKKPAYLADKRRPLTYLLPRVRASTAQPTLDLDNDDAPDAPTCTSWGCFR